MKKEKIALHLGRNATSVINGIISPPCANLGIIEATNPENRSQAKRKKRIKKTTADHAEFTSLDDEHAEPTSSDDEFFSQAAEHLAQAKKISQIGKDVGNYRTVVVRLIDADEVMEADI